MQHGKSKMSIFSYKDGQSMLGLVTFGVDDNTRAIQQLVWSMTTKLVALNATFSVNLLHLLLRATMMLSYHDNVFQ